MHTFNGMFPWKSARWFYSLHFLLLLLSLPSVWGQAEGADVVFHGKTLFAIRTPTADLTAAEAAELAASRLERFASNRSLDLSELHIEPVAGGDAIRAAANLIVLVTVEEAAAHQRSRSELAADWYNRLRAAAVAYRDTTSLRFWLVLVSFFLLYSALFAAAFWILRWLQQKARNLADWYTRRHLETRGSRLLSLFSAATLLDAIATAVSLARWVVVLVLFNFYVNYSIRLFPGTESISRTLGSYMLAPLYQLGGAVVAYLPSLSFVLVVALLANYLIRLSNYIFIKIARGAILVDGFYPDWAIPTAKLVRLLIIVLSVIIAFPYLPGAQSPAFQGVSLFIGVLFSLGSSSTISNVINGVILTYMRAFQIGDRVKIADLVGDVVEKNLLVTRLKTIRNEIVTIPNSQIMAAQILNYSVLAREKRLILFTTATIGYDIPWQRVHEILLAAAAATSGVQPDPAPYVWQRALNDFNVSYELNVYTADAPGMYDTYSALHANIQEHFHRAGIEIMSPNYLALRDGNASTVPPSDRPAGYEAPGFRIVPKA